MPRYIVTDKAGPEVAGRRGLRMGDTIELTEEQAEHPLRVGHIRMGGPAPEPVSEPTQAPDPRFVETVEEVVEAFEMEEERVAEVPPSKPRRGRPRKKSDD